MIKKTRFWRIRVFLILITMMFFIGCQKDDEVSSPQSQEIQESSSHIQTTTSNVSAEEIPGVMDYLATKGNNRGQFTITKPDNTTRSNEADLVIGTLQTKEIVQVTDQYDRKNYSFLLTSIEGTDSTVKSIFNLIVKESRKVGLFSYIIEYRPDSNWVYNYKDSQDFSNYTGDILYYTIEGVYKAKTTMFEGNFQTLETRENDCDTTGNDGEGNSGGNEGQDGNNDTTDTTDTSDTSDGDSNGDDTEGGLDACSFEIYNPPVDCGCLPNLVIICDENQNIVNGDTFDDFVRTTCGDVPETCFGPNNEPCNCNADGNGCDEETPPDDEGDSNPTIGPNIELNVPCINLKRRSENEDFNQKIGIMNVASNVSPPSDRFEKGFVMFEIDGNTVYSPRTSVANKPQIDFQIPNGEIVEGFIHNHFFINEEVNGVPTESINTFSSHDLVYLYVLAKNNHINNVHSFTYINVYQGNMSHLQINNLANLISIGDQYFVNPNGKISKSLVDSYAEGGILHTNNPTTNRDNLARLLKGYGNLGLGELGIELYTSTINNPAWKKVVVNDDDTITLEDCN